MTDDAYLSREEALVLLGELQDFLPRLEAGELDEEAQVEARRLVEGLAQLPLPPDVLEEHEKEVGMWSEVLLSRLGEDERRDAAPVSRQLENRVLRLKGMVEEGVEP